jgi:deoxyribodipyrimidine photo-lyase
MLDSLRLDRSIAPATGIAGGTSAALDKLRRFIGERLDGYALRRNHPKIGGTSGLSPYLHFGHIGPHTVALAVQAADAPAPDRAAFLEELIVRRELAINFVRFNPTYGNIESCEPWALRTLGEHARDRRERLYNERQLENAETQDELWSAAQRQMTESGWMHNYMRMYWAKKRLEWSPSPATAYQIAMRLNDCYELDDCDPQRLRGYRMGDRRQA